MPRIKLSRRRTLLFSTLAIVAGIVTISACSTEENPPAGTLALAVTPPSINVAAGGTGNASAAISRGGSFTGGVTLSATGNPAGVTVTFTPASVPAGATAATITVAVDAAVAAGSKTITISATGSGVTTATATLTVVVVGADAGAIALAANPAALTAAVGGAAVTSALTVTRTAPFAGAVGLTVTGAPANVTATVNPTSVAAGATTSTLSVTAAAGAVSGTYPLVIHGSGTGVADATVTVNATVTGGAGAGASFTFAPTPLPITAGGATATSTVTIARTGTFAPSGALNLTVTSATAGLTATVAPNTNVTAATAIITAQATGAVVAGTYDLTLTGTGTGIPNAVGTLPVTVTGGGGGGGSVSFTYCTENAPIWVAYQDGAGAWTLATPTGNTYQFTFASGKGGLAVVQPDGSGGNDLIVFYATVAEFTGAAPGLGAAGCGTKTVNGTVASVGVTEAAAVYLGPRTASASQADPNFVLSDVPDGSLDLMATRTTLPFTVNKIILRQGLNQADNSSISPTLDFGTQGFPPSTANTVTLGNLGSDNAVITSAFLGLNGSVSGGVGSIVGYTQASGAVAYNAIPVGELRTGEVQSLTTIAADASNSNALRYAGVYFHAPANKTITYGPDLTSPTVTKLVTGTVARPRMVLTGQIEYNKLFIANYTQDGLTPNRDVSVIATAGYFPTAPTTNWDVTVPDLSLVTGWVATWGLLDGTAIDWTVLAQGGTAQFLDPPTDGGTFQWAGLSSGSTPLTLRGLREDPALLQRRLLDFVERNRNPLR